MARVLHHFEARKKSNRLTHLVATGSEPRPDVTSFVDLVRVDTGG